MKPTDNELLTAAFSVADQGIWVYPDNDVELPIWNPACNILRRVYPEGSMSITTMAVKILAAEVRRLNDNI